MPAQISRSALQLASRLRLLMTFSFFLAASFLQAQVIQTLGPVGGGLDETYGLSILPDNSVFGRAVFTANSLLSSGQY